MKVNRKYAMIASLHVSVYNGHKRELTLYAYMIFILLYWNASSLGFKTVMIHCLT